MYDLFKKKISSFQQVINCENLFATTLSFNTFRKQKSFRISGNDVQRKVNFKSQQSVC